VQLLQYVLCTGKLPGATVRKSVPYNPATLKNLHLKSYIFVKKTTLLLTFLAFAATHLQAKVFYVKPGGTGNGSSWSMAFGDLQQALYSAVEGDEVWVAKGLYLPTQGSDRYAAFHVPSGVTLLGGFAGDEMDVNARDFTLNKTILSGEIGLPGDADNSFSVVVLSNANSQTRIDGFEITGGNANNPSRSKDPSNCGGGIFNSATGASSSPVIINCLIRYNKAFFGAGVFNNAEQAGDCSSTQILHCEFINNDAKLEGGAVYNQGTEGGRCNPIIRSCNFEGNQSLYGAGIFNFAGNGGKTSPLIDNCIFSGNGAGIRASAIYNHSSENGQCSPEILPNCHFENNAERVGGSIAGSPDQQNDKKQSKTGVRNIIIRTTPQGQGPCNLTTDNNR
jgi:hypothetical protein